MRKVLSLLIIAIAFSSCESDVKFSDPGFQGRKDNFTWRSDLTTANFLATDVSVDNTVGFLTIITYRGLETVTLRVPLDSDLPITKNNPAIYRFGYDPSHPEEDDNVSATYSYQDDGVILEYTTGFGLNEDREDQGNAEVIITEYDPAKASLSGTFKFNAKYQGESTLVPDNVNFQEGVFYHITRQ